MQHQAPQLELAVDQRLILTPRVQQALHILALPALQLEAYLLEASMSNPFLEVGAFSEGEEQAGPEDAGSEYWLELFDDASDLGPGISAQPSEWQPWDVAGQLQHLTLPDILREQIGCLELDEATRRACELVVEYLDERGYLVEELPEISRHHGIRVGILQRALRVVQKLEPRGVGARDLRECLLLQLEDDGGIASLARLMIQCCLGDLARGRLPKIARRLGVPLAQVKQARDLILDLKPAPGRGLADGEHPVYLRPDVTVRMIDGEPVIIMGGPDELKVRISPSYRRMLQQMDPSDPAYRFLREKLDSALWLLRCLRQRERTLRTLVECLIRHQRAFFEHGPSHLRPLTLAEVARDMGVHPSTVSRARRGKYVQTAWGLFSLEFFFPSGVNKTKDQQASAHTVKMLIREFISQEDPQRPLSDAQLVKMLGERGFRLSRRVVTKYRNALGILPSYYRRQPSKSP